MSKPKILLTNFHPGGGGGHTTYIQRLLAGGLGNQFEIAMAVPATSRLFQMAQGNGQQVFACEFPGNIKEIPGVLRAIRRLSEIRSKFPFEILHCNGSRDQTIAALWQVRHGAPVKIVRTHHAIRQVSVDPYHRWLHQRQTALHIYVSHAQANICEAGKALKLTPSIVIANGVDLQHFTPIPKSPEVLRELGLRPDQFIFGSIAGTGAYKRLDLMLHALARLPEHHARVAVVVLGGEPGGRQLEQLANKLGLASLFRFVSHKNDVRPYASVFDVGFLLSDSIESSPFAAREMMAMGCPLVCSGYSGLLEVVDDRMSGFITRVGDISSVAVAAEAFLKMPTERLLEFRAAARDKAVRCFSQEQLSQKTREAYQRLLPGSQTSNSK